MGLGYEEEQKKDWVVCGRCGVAYAITQKCHCDTKDKKETT